MRIRNIILISSTYILLIIVVRFIVSPEKYIYGHDYENKFLEFLIAVVVIPASMGLGSLAKTNKQNRSFGLAILFFIYGFLGLLGSTMIEKLRVSYELNQSYETTTGVIDYTYLQRSSSRSSTRNFNFVVSFVIDGISYYSLPGSTKKEIYHIGDSIKVIYLKRNPFLNKIIY